ncbi:hypothetical protein BS47DRAFT_1364575 [Hydnum rufescens UP504]|uniref:Uncharacterized protein n=1 Tax=Hydnum rufescens UP504 TaxID=1448309 RepID=A0A9P6DU95_9AGAM|nr:hypothetical protein BS47DRAFT_1364575 [Hydnum rufescens UP504]
MADQPGPNEHLFKAEQKLDDHSIQYFLAQFKEQHDYQSKPMTCQSKLMGACAVKQILILSETADLWAARLEDLDVKLFALEKEGLEVTASSELKTNIDETREALHNAMDATSFTSLEEMRQSPWINAQLNLHVLHTQLVAKLHAQKFELSSLDHAHTNQKLDHSTHAHINVAIKSCTPVIQSNLKCYNEMIQQLLSMRGKNDIPNDAYIPPEIKLNGLLKMDATKKAFDVSADLDVKYFLLTKLHYLNDIGLQWKADAVALLGADGGPEWDVMPQLPLLQKARSCTKTEDLVESVIIDGMSDNASSDNDDGGELEEALSEVDVVVLNALDHVDSWFHAA